jgi:universal stress protein A
MGKRDPGAGASRRANMPIRRILVPTDFSPGAAQALDYAVDLARSFGAELVLLFVVEPVYYASPADLYGASANLSMLLDEQRRVGREQLDRFLAETRKRRVRCRGVVETGAPYETITGAAEKVAADLIVMATHGRTGLSHLLLGSVTEKVVRSSACPVLTLRRYDRPAAGKSARRRSAPRRKRRAEG